MVDSFVNFSIVGSLHDACPPGCSCVGCDIVQADHAPEAGVAQGIFHGILVRHHGEIQEEVEEGLEEEVERRVKRERTLKQPNTSAHAWMIWNDTQARLEPNVTYEHICAMHLKTVRSVL